MRETSQLLGTGLKGLVGSRLVADIGDRYQIFSLDVSDPVQPVDITNLEQIKLACAKHPAEVMVHLAAYTNVSGAWKQSGDKSGAAYQVNVVGTQNLITACQEFGLHLIHISTAYVFDGQKLAPYTEQDRPHPIEWYGQTKLWAEEAVQAASCPWTILRIDQPFRSDRFSRLDIAHKVLDGLTADNLVPQFTDHYFGPTFINDFVKVIDWVIRTKTTGLFHASSGEQWTDYEFAQQIKQSHHLSGQIKAGSLVEYQKTSARPYQQNTALDVTVLKSQLDFSLTPINEALKTLHI